jgi:transcriptional regulator with XRE-family HTH domain
MYNRVKILRQQLRIEGKKVTQEKLANMIGMTRSSLAEFESFNGKISPETEGKLMKIFKLTDKSFLYK